MVTPAKVAMAADSWVTVDIDRPGADIEWLANSATHSVENRASFHLHFCSRKINTLSVL
jgi:hypothetical protein